MTSITIDNSKDSSVSGVWSNPGAGMYDRILESSNYQALLKEAYLVAPVGRIKNTENDKTSFSASGMGYPHHVIRGDKLVLHRAGLRAAFSRGRQQGIVSGEVEAHLKRHYREMGWYEESAISGKEAEHSNLSSTVKMGEELKHYGILGMRWGIRRDRDSSGRVTSQESQRSRELKRKHISEMSNKEIQEIVTRMNLEKQYRQLNPTVATKGKTIVNNILKRIGNRILDRVIDKSVDAAIDSAFTTVTRGLKAQTRLKGV